MTDFSGSKSIKSSLGGIPDYEPARALLFGACWTTGAPWPKLSSNFIFLADALVRLGTEQFDWDGTERLVKDDDRDTPAERRLRAAAGALASNGREGKLQTYLWTGDGKPKRADASIWFGSDDLFLVATCTDRRNGHVFIDSADFAALLAKGGTPLANGQSEIAPLGIYLSPYMRLMHHVLQSHHLTEEDQSTVQSLKWAIAKAAPSVGLDVNPKYLGEAPGPGKWAPLAGTVELSDNLLKAMATLMRSFEAAKGNAG